MDITSEKCFSCGAIVPAIEWQVHPYMDSLPGCWYLFNQILEKEFSDPAYRVKSRLTTDAYAVQHYGMEKIPQAMKSVNHHLISLCFYFEFKMTLVQSDAAFRKLAKYKDQFTWLTPPKSVGEITVADVIKAKSAEEHLDLVEKWAWSAWNAWAEHHNTIKRFISEYYNF